MILLKRSSCQVDEGMNLVFDLTVFEVLPDFLHYSKVKQWLVQRALGMPDGTGETSSGKYSLQLNSNNYHKGPYR
jgi:hypothetical protein